MPSPAAVHARAHEHRVVFHASDRHLASVAADHLVEGLRARARMAVVIAVGSRRQAIVRELGNHGIRPGDARLELVDAEESVDLLLDADGHPDPSRYDAAIGDPVRELAAQGPLVVFGELSAVLWQRREILAAFDLEEQSDSLRRELSLRTLCGYPSDVFDFASDATGRGIVAICDAHDTVVPSDAAAHLLDMDDPWRSVVLLQHQLAGLGEQRAAQEEREAQLRQRFASLRAELEEVRVAALARERATAMVAHDIRTPVTVISTLLELMRTTAADDAREEYLDVAVRSVSQIQRLVDDLLLLTRLDAGRLPFELETLDLGRLVAEEVGAARRLTSRSIELFVRDELPPVRADGGRQRQILSNLLSNAERYSDPDTIVTVTLEQGDGHVVVRVRDRGRGIAPGQRGRLFQPFSQLVAGDERTGGTGLGLAITKALVEGQGGTIDVSSEPGIGTTLSYTVPTVEP